MLFNTFEFLIFFFSVLLVFFSVPQKRRWFILLLASYFFYGYWKPSYLILIAGSTVADYLLSNAIGKSKSDRKRKRLLSISLILNLSLLFAFKYFDFLADSFNEILTTSDNSYKIKLLNLALPVHSKQ